MNSTDKVFYVIGLVLWGGLLALFFLRHTSLPSLTDVPLPCSFRAATGLYCPGCGGTHAVYALLSGHFLESIRFHPFVLYTALGFLIYLLWNAAAALVNRQQKRTPLPYFHFQPICVYIGIGILFAQWILKNVLLFVLP